MPRPADETVTSADRAPRRGLAPLAAAIGLALAIGAVSAVLLHRPSKSPHAGAAAHTATPGPVRTPVPTPPPERPDVTSSAIAADLLGGLLLVGARTDEAVSETWQWRSGRWAQLHPAVAPPARLDAWVVADPAQGVVLLYGGMQETGTPSQQQTILHDTWAWDGTTWTQLQPRHHPGGTTFESQIAYDPVHRVVVVLDTEGATWTWDGRDWTLRQASSLPERAYPEALAWDSATRSVLLLADESTSQMGAPRATTWSWNGSAWVRRHPRAEWPADLGNALPAVEAPSGDGVVVLFGTGKAGYGTPVVARWDGTTWSSAPSPSGPPSCDAFVLTTDRRALCVSFQAVSLGLSLVEEWTGAAWVEAR